MSDPKSRWQIMDETLGKSRMEMLARNAELCDIVNAWNGPLALLLDKSFLRAIDTIDHLRHRLREIEEGK